MKTLKARVRQGRLVLDEPTTLPEGTEVELVAVDCDELDADDRARLHVALEASEGDVECGRVRPALELVAELKSETPGPGESS